MTSIPPPFIRLSMSLTIFLCLGLSPLGAHSVIQPWSPPGVSMPTTSEQAVLEPAGWTDRGGQEKAITNPMPGSPGVRANRTESKEVEYDTERPPTSPQQHFGKFPRGLNSPKGLTRIRRNSSGIATAKMPHLRAEAADDEDEASSLAKETDESNMAPTEPIASQLVEQETLSGERGERAPGQNERKLSHTYINARTHETKARVSASPPAIQISTSTLAVPVQHPTADVDKDPPRILSNFQSRQNWLSPRATTKPLPDLADETMSGEEKETETAGTFWLSAAAAPVPAEQVSLETGDLTRGMRTGIDPAPWLVSMRSSSSGALENLGGFQQEHGRQIKQRYIGGSRVGGGGRSSKVIKPSWESGQANSDRLTSWEKDEILSRRDRDREAQGGSTTEAIVASVLGLNGCDPRSCLPPPHPISLCSPHALLLLLLFWLPRCPCCLSHALAFGSLFLDLCHAAVSLARTLSSLSFSLAHALTFQFSLSVSPSLFSCSSHFLIISSPLFHVHLVSHVCSLLILFLFLRPVRAGAFRSRPFLLVLFLLRLYLQRRQTSTEGTLYAANSLLYISLAPTQDTARPTHGSQKGPCLKTNFYI